MALLKAVALLPISFLSTIVDAAPLSNRQSVCQMISPKYRMGNIGKTITVNGTYSADLERAILLPDKCKVGIGVGDISPSALKFLNRFPTDVITTVHASFTGKLALETPIPSQFYRDDGVRFVMISASRKN
jgi:hypothetical protein